MVELTFRAFLHAQQTQDLISIMENDTNTEIAPDLLPTEIIDVIVDQLHGDMPSLRTCSLTSKQFVSRAQKHLFCTIQLISLNHLFDMQPMAS
ncbi:hypothetical protein Hypma_005601 [Hypsizygus marmoreus]|uniref:F-box domain-containing protein n=1 Tax=Hypsizygus marmoreus TaxID=39966 RepID=A0A369JYU3_HYPMA|nr:hypothetical protein Hypma_005601 [Hypsizygus marmoreus]